MENQIVNSKETCSENFRKLLQAKQCAPEINKVGIYDRLIGCWRAELIDYLEDGIINKSTGDWVFSYILAGRAIQDVLVEMNPSNKTRNRFGTTIRVFDNANRQWKMFWFNPLSGARNELTARADGDNIIQEGVTDRDSLIRWVFNDIKESSFHWYGEESIDDGINWRTWAEFFATRK